MNLISCDNCGVVLDAKKLNFPTDIEEDNGSIINTLAGWNGRDYVPKVECPVCECDILENKDD